MSLFVLTNGSQQRNTREKSAPGDIAGTVLDPPDASRRTSEKVKLHVIDSQWNDLQKSGCCSRETLQNHIPAKK